MEGQLENLNFMVIPTVQNFKFYRSTKPVPNIANKFIRRDSGLLEINAQAIGIREISETFFSGVKNAFSFLQLYVRHLRIKNFYCQHSWSLLSADGRGATPVALRAPYVTPGLSHVYHVV